MWRKSAEKYLRVFVPSFIKILPTLNQNSIYGIRVSLTKIEHNSYLNSFNGNHELLMSENKNI